VFGVIHVDIAGVDDFVEEWVIGYIECIVVTVTTACVRLGAFVCFVRVPVVPAAFATLLFAAPLLVALVGGGIVVVTTAFGALIYVVISSSVVISVAGYW